MTITPIPRPSGRINSLDYTNCWRSQHTEPPCHGDRMSCSTRPEISIPAGLSWRSEVVFNSARDLLPRSLIWVLEHRQYSHPLRFIPIPSAKELVITFHPGIGIAYVTTIRNRHSKTVDRVLDSRNSVPGPKFHLGASVLVHRLSYPLGQMRIFVRPGVGTALEAPYLNQHIDL
ncbi:hypothetical protein Taro_047504, partial [Colocasia esculenta]|nr:hypothetical protein [Colocasia esculenta]